MRNAYLVTVLLLMQACAGQPPIISSKISTEQLASLDYGFSDRQVSKLLLLSRKRWHIDFVLDGNYYERYLVYNTETHRQYSLLFKNHSLHSLSELKYQSHQVRYYDIVGECGAFPVTRIQFPDAYACLKHHVALHEKNELDLEETRFHTLDDELETDRDKHKTQQQRHQISNAVVLGIMNPFLPLLVVDYASDDNPQTKEDRMRDALAFKLAQRHPLGSQVNLSSVEHEKDESLTPLVSSANEKTSVLYYHKELHIPFAIGIHDGKVIWRLFDPHGACAIYPSSIKCSLGVRRSKTINELSNAEGDT